MTRAEWAARRSATAWAMQEAASSVGKDSPLYKAMGSVAWGRYDGEPTATDSKDNTVFGVGFLEGVRHVLIHMARAQMLDARPFVDTHEKVRRRLQPREEQRAS